MSLGSVVEIALTAFELVMSATRLWKLVFGDRRRRHRRHPAVDTDDEDTDPDSDDGSLDHGRLEDEEMGTGALADGASRDTPSPSDP
ncbi:hypothetical protein Dda_8671 [Drechslerella dactyloides]|uniref:Uncharacterized protein n=1 Tax=Drechslerella dactyloides TaxID=74499 RepID=A0AAD6IQQ3_DREDA|nr:hypothetical protein Dda_8671 [Drechslerella dactyloides]